MLTSRLRRIFTLNFFTRKNLLLLNFSKNLLSLSDFYFYTTKKSYTQLLVICNLSAVKANVIYRMNLYLVRQPLLKTAK